jgi:SAM-dependent methyltransferase
MSDADRTRWEAKHEQTSLPSLPLASIAWIGLSPAAGLALDLACGKGRHCGPLLERGYRVVAADVAGSALRTLARFHAALREGRMMAVQTDLDHWAFRPEVFDLVVQTDFLDRRLFGSIKASLRPGGRVLVDTFCGEADGHGPSCRDYRLAPGELARVFADWEIVRSATVPGRDALLARKPSSLTRSPRSATRTS